MNPVGNNMTLRYFCIFSIVLRNCGRSSFSLENVGSRSGIIDADMMASALLALVIDVLYIPNVCWSNCRLTIKMSM